MQITRVTTFDGQEDLVDVYDITVQPHHNYVLEAGGLVVSNSKRLSLLDANAVLSAGGFGVLKDSSVRGQKNEDYWFAYLQGHAPPRPQVPMVYEKFLNQLKAGGINVIPDGHRLHLGALTDKDVDQLAGDREITSSKTVKFDKNMEPIPGGLFDVTQTGGLDGNRWSFLRIPEPYPNPAFEEPIRRVLGLTEDKFEKILAGEEEFRGLSGPKAIHQALDQLDVPQELQAARAAIASGKKTARDVAVRKLGYLKTADRLGIHPRDWMVTKVPILPPKFRPVALMQGTGCFHGRVQVWTESGMMRIDDLVRHRRQVRVWSYDFASSEFVLRPITNWFENQAPEGIGRSLIDAVPGRLSCSQRSFRPTTLWGTRGHRVYQEDGNTVSLGEAQNLLAVEEGLSYSQGQLVYGSLLGAGHVSPTGHYVECHGLAQEDYLRLKADILSPFIDLPPYKVSVNCKPEAAWRVATIAHAAFRHARDLCYVGQRKTICEAWLDKLDPLGLAFWFMDDGTSFRSGGTVATIHLSTQCFSRAEIAILRSWLMQRWGFISRLMRHNAHYQDRDAGWVVSLRGDHAEKFLNLVAPFVPPCLQYKMLDAPITGCCPECGKKIKRTRQGNCWNCRLRTVRSAQQVPQALQKQFGAEVTRFLATKAADIPEPCGDESHLARLPRIGTSVEAVRADNKITFRLEKVPCQFTWRSGAAQEQTRTVFDIEVGGTHNYVANGVLVSNSSKVPLVADANYLLRELLDAVENFNGLKDHVHDKDLGQERRAIYQNFKALTGLTAPTHPKLVEKRVRGLLAQVVGSGPKTSAVQRQLLSRNVDLVGRAVITPDADLDLDSVGLPENSAWDIYAPAIRRGLKRQGMSLLEAGKHVLEKSPLARKMLLEEVQNRPVLMTRAPVLHKYGIMAYWPKLVKGDVVRVNPLVINSMGGDYDGDAVNFHAPVDEAAVHDAVHHMLPSRNLISPADFKKPMFAPIREYAGGLHYASKEKNDRKPHVFANTAAALLALRRGEIDAADPIEVLKS